MYILTSVHTMLCKSPSKPPSGESWFPDIVRRWTSSYEKNTKILFIVYKDTSTALDCKILDIWIYITELFVWKVCLVNKMMIKLV